jgi:S1-C subfamily serine protease
MNSRLSKVAARGLGAARIPDSGRKVHVASDVIARGSRTVRNLPLMSTETVDLSFAVTSKVVQIASLKITGNGEDRLAGVFVSSDGYLLTNAHVIANAMRVTVLVECVAVDPNANRTRQYVARVVGMDTDSDLALLKIDAESLPFFDLSCGAGPRQSSLVLAQE